MRRAPVADIPRGDGGSGDDGTHGGYGGRAEGGGGVRRGAVVSRDGGEVYGRGIGRRDRGRARLFDDGKDDDGDGEALGRSFPCPAPP